MVVENLLKEKIGEYLLKKYSITNTPVEIIKTRKEFKGDYTVVLFPILSLTKLKPNQIGEDIGKYLMDNENYIEDFNIIWKHILKIRTICFLKVGNLFFYYQYKLV